MQPFGVKSTARSLIYPSLTPAVRTHLCRRVEQFLCDRRKPNKSTASPNRKIAPLRNQRPSRMSISIREQEIWQAFQFWFSKLSLFHTNLRRVFPLFCTSLNDRRASSPQLNCQLPVVAKLPRSRRRPVPFERDRDFVGTNDGSLSRRRVKLCVVVESFEDKRVGFRPARRRYVFLVHNRASNLWIAFFAGRLIERQINFSKRFA